MATAAVAAPVYLAEAALLGYYYSSAPHMVPEMLAAIVLIAHLYIDVDIGDIEAVIRLECHKLPAQWRRRQFAARLKQYRHKRIT